MGSFSGSIRLFRVAGIQVFLHWSWLLVAVYQVSTRVGSYSSPLWNVAEYLSLFLIVLLHEFGHAFASRQVGGESKEILLWPFGGIAFVKVPPRPGAELWSIAAGPLVNVLLFPVLLGLVWTSRMLGWSSANPDLDQFMMTMWFINTVVLVFNLLPIYPLDGGQMLRSLLWFGVGRARSLQIATVIGFIGVGALVVRAVLSQSLFSGFVALFLGQQCYAGWQHAKALGELERLPRHPDFACPTCQASPPGGPLWLCARCGNRFDPFSTRAVCPHCQTPQAETACPNCGAAHAIDAWDRVKRPAEPPIIDV